MSDLISRQDAILALLEKGQRSRRYKLGEVWELNFDEIREALETVPSAEQQWIPVSERPPKYSDSVLVSLFDDEIDLGSYYCDTWHTREDGSVEDGIVLAWMPTPKPYEVKE